MSETIVGAYVFEREQLGRLMLTGRELKPGDGGMIPNSQKRNSTIECFYRLRNERDACESMWI